MTMKLPPQLDDPGGNRLRVVEQVRHRSGVIAAVSTIVAPVTTED
jgi:hypothetical protein